MRWFFWGISRDRFHTCKTNTFCIFATPDVTYGCVLVNSPQLKMGSCDFKEKETSLTLTLNQVIKEKKAIVPSKQNSYTFCLLHFASFSGTPKNHLTKASQISLLFCQNFICEDVSWSVIYIVVVSCVRPSWLWFQFAVFSSGTRSAVSIAKKCWASPQACTLITWLLWWWSVW